MSIEIQQRIKNNAKQVKDYINDLYEWEEQMNHKQEKVQHNPSELTHQIKQIKDTAQKRQTNQQFKTLKRDTNTVGDYYKAWDKFDVDQELKVLDKESNKIFNPYQNSKNNIRAKPKAEMVVKGGRAQIKDPTSLKDRGNMYFNSCEFDKAIQCYTDCLVKLQQQINNQLKAIVLSNRAMARLKRNQLQQAIDDCNQSLTLNPLFVKSYSRRASAFKRLKKYKLAKVDYQKILSIQQNNQEAVTELDKINKILQNFIKQAHEKLLMKMNFSTVPTERIQIRQVEEQEDSNKPVNYLQEL